MHGLAGVVGALSPIWSKQSILHIMTGQSSACRSKISFSINCVFARACNSINLFLGVLCNSQKRLSCIFIKLPGGEAGGFLHA